MEAQTYGFVPVFHASHCSTLDCPQFHTPFGLFPLGAVVNSTGMNYGVGVIVGTRVSGSFAVSLGHGNSTFNL